MEKEKAERERAAMEMGNITGLGPNVGASVGVTAGAAGAAAGKGAGSVVKGKTVSTTG